MLFNTKDENVKKPRFTVEVSIIADKEIPVNILTEELKMSLDKEGNFTDVHQENWTVIKQRYFKLNSAEYASIHDFDINWIKFAALMLSINDTVVEGIITITENWVTQDNVRYIEIESNQFKSDGGIYIVPTSEFQNEY